MLNEEARSAAERRDLATDELSAEKDKYAKLHCILSEKDGGRQIDYVEIARLKEKLGNADCKVIEGERTADEHLDQARQNILKVKG